MGRGQGGGPRGTSHVLHTWHLGGLVCAIFTPCAAHRGGVTGPGIWGVGSGRASCPLGVWAAPLSIQAPKERPAPPHPVLTDAPLEDGPWERASPGPEGTVARPGPPVIAYHSRHRAHKQPHNPADRGQEAGQETQRPPAPWPSRPAAVAGPAAPFPAGPVPPPPAPRPLAWSQRGACLAGAAGAPAPTGFLIGSDPGL